MDYGTHQQTHVFWLHARLAATMHSSGRASSEKPDPARKVAPCQNISVDNAQLHNLHLKICTINSTLPTWYKSFQATKHVSMIAYLRRCNMIRDLWGDVSNSLLAREYHATES